MATAHDVQCTLYMYVCQERIENWKQTFFQQKMSNLYTCNNLYVYALCLRNTCTCAKNAKLD